MEESEVEVFEIKDITEKARKSSELYEEFLRVPSLSAGLYLLRAGARDPQTPHGEDEIYYVLNGRGTIEVQGQTREIHPGSVIFVPAKAEHRFQDIKEDLALLVLFSPAEGTKS